MCWSIFNKEGMFDKISVEMQLSQADQYGCTQRHHVNTIVHPFSSTTKQLVVQLAISKNLLSICVDLLPVRLQILMLKKMKSAISKSFESLVHNFLEPHRPQLCVDACLCHTAMSPLGTLPEGAEIFFLCHFHVNTKPHWDKRGQSIGILVMILEVIFKMKSCYFENELGAMWPCLYFFLAHDVYFMHWNWTLLSRFVYCNGRTSFIPSLITVLDFILKMFSLCAPIS